MLLFEVSFSSVNDLPANIFWWFQRTKSKIHKQLTSMMSLMVAYQIDNLKLAHRTCKKLYIFSKLMQWKLLKG